MCRYFESGSKNIYVHFDTLDLWLKVLCKYHLAWELNKYLGTGLKRSFKIDGDAGNSKKIVRLLPLAMHMGMSATFLVDPTSYRVPFGSTDNASFAVICSPECMHSKLLYLIHTYCVRKHFTWATARFFETRDSYLSLHYLSTICWCIQQTT